MAAEGQQTSCWHQQHGFRFGDTFGNCMDVELTSNLVFHIKIHVLV